MRGSTSFGELFPEEAREADGWDPFSVPFGAAKKRRWLCAKFGHSYESSPNKRSTGQGCPYCSGRRLLIGFNDLATTEPDLAKQAFGWDPSRYQRGSAGKLAWRCDSTKYPPHSWVATIGQRLRGQGCAVCAHKQIIKGINDLATTHPDIAVQADGWDPSTVTAYSNKSLAWKCPAGHITKKQVNWRTQAKKSGCKICANLQVEIGFNDLASKFPEVAAEADGWDPTTVVFGAEKKRAWKCSICGFRWSANVDSRTRIGAGCPACAGNILVVGVNDLASKAPHLVAEWDWTKNEMGPDQVAVGSRPIVWWICPNGHSYKSPPYRRTGGYESGCPDCSHTGFKPNSPAWLYFLRHSHWGLLQMGITNEPEIRLAAHQSQGWEVIEAPRGPMPGMLTHQWEQDILKALRRRFVSLGPEHIAGKFSGYTESWIEEDFPVKSLAELMQLVHDDEN